jgi:hypothetical protein
VEIWESRDNFFRKYLERSWYGFVTATCGRAVAEPRSGRACPDQACEHWMGRGYC